MSLVPSNAQHVPAALCDVRSSSITATSLTCPVFLTSDFTFARLGVNYFALTKSYGAFVYHVYNKGGT